MIQKENYFYCFDASTSSKGYLSVWCDRRTGEAFACIHDEKTKDEVFVRHIEDRLLVTRASFQVLSLSLSILEVFEQTQMLPHNSFIIKKVNVLSGNVIAKAYTPPARYEQFICAKETENSLIVAFLYFEDEFSDVPQGIALLEFDSSLNLINKRDHSLGGRTTPFVNYFCSTATNREMYILLEDEEGEASVAKFSFDHLSFLSCNKLIPAELGFGYIRACAVKDGCLYLISANWNLFEVCLQASKELSRKRMNCSGDKIPSALFWDRYRWVVARSDARITKIDNNATDFILSIED